MTIIWHLKTGKFTTILVKDTNKPLEMVMRTCSALRATSTVGLPPALPMQLNQWKGERGREQLFKGKMKALTVAPNLAFIASNLTSIILHTWILHLDRVHKDHQTLQVHWNGWSPSTITTNHKAPNYEDFQQYFKHSPDCYTILSLSLAQNHQV